jgi:hypothetical protein
MPDRDRVADLVAQLEEDSAGPSPRFPAQAQLALRDDGVVDAVVARMDRGQTVTDIWPLPYHAESGLLFVCFDFGPPKLLGAGREALLVMLTGEARVAGILDPFDARRPNPAMAAPDESEQGAGPVPFALSRPSVTETQQFTAEDLQPAQARTQAFFARQGGPGGGLGGGGFANDGTTRTQIGTQTTWIHGGWTPGPFTWVERDEKIDEMTDDAIA